VIDMKKFMLLLLPLFISAGQDYKEVPTQPNGFFCSRCSKNKRHDDRIKLAIQCSVVIGYFATITGFDGLMNGKTYLERALLVVCAGVTCTLTTSIGSWAQNKLLIMNPDYRCSNHLFCEYASLYSYSN